MVNLLQKLFSYPGAALAGLVAFGGLSLVISKEPSVQPLQNPTGAEQFVSKPLMAEAGLTQELNIPGGLTGETFLVGLFFGCPEGPCVGGAQVSLIQGTHTQTHAVTGIAPAPTLRHRFKFTGFKEGPAVLTVIGLPGNGESAPGILYVKEGVGASMSGSGLEEPAYASVDWFKVIPGDRKFSNGFPNVLVSLIWISSFAGIFGMAWAGMNPNIADSSETPGKSKDLDPIL